MADIDTASGNPQPAESLVTLTHVIYALHAFTVVTGILSSAFILTAFLTGWPSILAVILNYLKRDKRAAPISNPTSAGRYALSGLRCCGWPSPGC